MRLRYYCYYDDYSYTAAAAATTTTTTTATATATTATATTTTTTTTTTAATMLLLLLPPAATAMQVLPSGIIALFPDCLLVGPGAGQRLIHRASSEASCALAVAGASSHSSSAPGITTSR